MMVDCWRRLYFYWKSRRNWKSVTWHYTYEWHAHKMKGGFLFAFFCCARSIVFSRFAFDSVTVIFAAWKSLTQPHTRPPVNTGHPSNAGHVHSKHPPSAGQHHAKTSSTAASSATTSNRSHNPYISETDTENESEPPTPRGKPRFYCSPTERMVEPSPVCDNTALLTLFPSLTCYLQASCLVQTAPAA